MANERRIKLVVPANYNPVGFFEKMPSPYPTHRGREPRKVRAMIGVIICENTSS